MPRCWGASWSPRPRGWKRSCWQPSGAQDLTRQLLAFGRKQNMEPQLCDLNQVVGETGKMLNRIIGEHIQLEMTLTPDPVLVIVDPGQLSQVMMNLAINARDAMPHGGHLLVETSRFQVEEHHVRARHQNGFQASTRCSPWPIRAPAWMRPPCRISSNPSSPPRIKARGPGLASRPCTDRQAERRPHMGLQRTGPRHPVQDLPPIEHRTTDSPGRGIHPVPAARLGDDPPGGGRCHRPLRGPGRPGELGLSGPGGGGPAGGIEISEAYPGPIHLLISDVVIAPFQWSGTRAAHPGTTVRSAGALHLGLYGRRSDPAGRRTQECGFLQKPFNMRDLNRKVRRILDAPPGSAGELTGIMHLGDWWIGSLRGTLGG